ncbi:sensor histidine kinase YpdA [Desulfosporosinus acididurans]|uniref:Sensor histidine kinase YpdA n=1 Tax=Desulfosporosinus acididurans TaxID=476652 RepID=A0A0J1FSD7_9FIRM|nr:histidine kinase [Desulfosporosinus acididurans]KLU66389.1 sensor histidine kinase YpdA [Desulfosporosinus acididurans]
MDLKTVWTKISSKYRIMLVIIVPAIMIYTLINVLLFSSAIIVHDGKADLSGIDFSHNTLVALDGQWEFYWNKLLMPEDFKPGHRPQMDSFMKVPGVWSDNAGTHYACQGIATYRLSLYYPSTLKDPALRIQSVANAYKLYVNGQLMAKVGSALNSKANFKNDDEIVIIDLPKDTQKIDLVFQVGNLNCATGGLRFAPVFGSKQVLEQQRMMMLILQLLLMGGVLIFGIHYFFLFLLQTKNKTALFFAVFCFLTAVRSLIWGEIPLVIVFPNVSPNLKMYINYLTGYNYVAMVILFVYSIYPLEFNKKIMSLILLPSLVFDVFLMIAIPEIMSFYTNYLYILLLLQMLYIMGVLMKAVLRKRDNAVLMFTAICILIWAMNEDIANFILIGSTNLSCVFLLGNFVVILAMSFVQARQQAMNHKKLILYNEKLLEADRLKDKIMATEMSFLQAQIKPHFLYNALSAIANVCEKDAKQAGKLIIDLAIYLRGSLGFNNLDKMVTIEKELEFVDTYFNIEQARFGQKIQLCKKIEISLDFQMPVLILQPLVENAVRHGISKKPEGGTVTVQMMQKDGNIYIKIEDDGVGINGDKLAAILSGHDNIQGVGFLNIHNRLLKLYGRGLEISSEPGYTCVKFSIPEVA